ncbi:hypothetical protein BGZ52_012921, partial [Haplosporangium bisporale]
MQANRESIIPTIARIRRHVFQNSCLGGYRIEGWENELGQPLLGSEADNLVRGGIQEVEPASASRPGLTTNSRSAPSISRIGVDTEDEVAILPGEQRGSGGEQARVPDAEGQETSIDHNNPLIVHNGRVILSAGRAPLSTLAPGNMLGSE